MNGLWLSRNSWEMLGICGNFIIIIIPSDSVIFQRGRYTKTTKQFIFVKKKVEPASWSMLVFQFHHMITMDGSSTMNMFLFSFSFMVEEVKFSWFNHQIWWVIGGKIPKWHVVHSRKSLGNPYVFFKAPMTIKVLPSECSAMGMRRSDRYRCCCDSHILEPGSSR